MARSFNQVVLMGNLTRDPELRQIPSGQSVCSFSLALNRRYKSSDGDWQEATDYVDVVAWASLGERVAQYVTKGRPVLVSGRLQSRSWEKDGQKRSKLEVVALDVTFLGGRGNDNPDSGNYSSSSSSPAPAKKEADNTDSKGTSKSKKQDDKNVNIEDVDDEPINLDDIPF